MKFSDVWISRMTICGLTMRCSEPGVSVAVAIHASRERFHPFSHRFALLHPSLAQESSKLSFSLAGFRILTPSRKWQEEYGSLSERFQIVCFPARYTSPLSAPSRGEPLRQSRGIALLPAGDLHPPT